MWFIIGLIIGGAGGAFGMYKWITQGVTKRLKEMEDTIKDGIEEGKGVKLEDLDDFLKSIMKKIEDIW